MSDNQRGVESSSSSSGNRIFNDEHAPDNAISWSIHAAPESPNDSGSSSSGSSEGGGRGVQTNAELAAENDHALRLAHAMTHNPVDALLPSPPRSPPRAIPDPYSGFGKMENKGNNKMVTVNDIKNRNCWICSDGDADEDTLPSNGKPKRWIHPCKCSLIAHQDCLLVWIRTRRARDPKQPIQCPQCSQIYSITEQKPFSLRIMDAGNKFFRDLIPIATTGIMGGGILVAATAYGCSAIRLWVGKDAAVRLLHGKWPWHYYVDIPLIPFALIMSRFRILDMALTFVPTLAAWPILQFNFLFSDFTSGGAMIRSMGHRRTWNHRGFRSESTFVATHRPYPPGPALTLLLVPWVRAIYIMLKLRITRKVLKPFSRRRINQTAQSASANNGERRQTRLIVIGDEAPGETLDENGTVNVDEDGNLRDLPPGTEAATENGRTIYVSPQSLAKACLGALSSPIIANLMGKLLARVARYSTFLRRFLGIESFTTASSFNFQKPSATQTSTASSPSMTPLARLFSTGSLYPSKDLDKPSLEPIAPQPIYDAGNGLTWYQPSNTFDDLDPVWFRNTIGAGIFIVIKDILQLRYRYLKLEHAREGAKRTKIVDRPFVGGIVSELELRDDVEENKS